MTEIAEQLDRRRREVAERWNLGRELVLISAGEPIGVPGRGDLCYPFRAHSEYFYLTDRERPGGVLAFDSEGGWTDFVRPTSTEEILWEGAPAEDQPGEPIAGLEGWLSARSGRPLALLGSSLSGLASEVGLADELRRGLNQVRRCKDEVELERMRTAERATRAGFAAVVSELIAGRSERAVQIELEAEFFRAGADRLAFDTIVGSGPNSAVLHFAPSARRLNDGELVLIDAGGEYRGYASDVTRTFAVGGSLSSEQAALYGVVRGACEAAIERCTAGTEFRDVHRVAALVIGEGLADFGLLRGDPEALVERGAVTLFFPHGVGHLVGLGVRDASEVLPGRQPEPGMPRLRTDLALAPDYVTTIEPGVYLVPALLTDPETRAGHREAVDWDRVDRMLGFGGIRLEHNVLITADGNDVLTGGIPL